MDVDTRTARGAAIVAITALAAVVAPPSLDAQGVSVLELLEPAGELSLGDTVQSALSSSDYRSSGDTYMEAWTFVGQAGETATFDMVSDDVDALLLLVGPGLDETLVDDDGGGACHARLTATFLENGTYHVVASSAVARESGVYTLGVSEHPGPVARHSCGGISPEALEALDTEGRTLSVGETASGALTRSAPQVPTGYRGVAWTLEGREGESVNVTLASDAFDAYLLITGPGLTDVLTDDDGAGEYNSLITLTFPVTGSYKVVASTIEEGGVGPYTLTVTRPIELRELDTEERTVSVGGVVEGRLTSDDPLIAGGRHGEAWALEGAAGERYTIDLASSEFDSYLLFVGPGIEEPLGDDDGGGGLDSRLRITLPTDGLYRVIVTSINAGATGTFRLRVTQE